MNNVVIAFPDLELNLLCRETKPDIACRVFQKELRDLRFSQQISSQQKDIRTLSFDEYQKQLKEDKVEHLSLRISASLVSVARYFENQYGKELILAERFSFYPNRQEIPHMKSIYPIVTTLSETQREQLISFSRQSFSFSRFYKDSFFEKSRCDELYEEIVRSLLSLPSEEFRIVVATKGQDAIGFIVGRRRLEERNGSVCMVTGGGFGAVAPGHTGCYVNLVEAGLKLCSPDSDVIEFDSQADNPKAQHIFSKFGMTKTLQEKVWHVKL